MRLMHIRIQLMEVVSAVRRRRPRMSTRELLVLRARVFGAAALVRACVFQFAYPNARRASQCTFPWARRHWAYAYPNACAARRQWQCTHSSNVRSWSRLRSACWARGTRRDAFMAFPYGPLIRHMRIPVRARGDMHSLCGPPIRHMQIRVTRYFGPLSARIRGLFVRHTRTGNPLVDSVAEHQPASADACVPPHWTYACLVWAAH